MSAASGKSGRPDVGGIGISNPQRVIDARSGGTKLQLAEYYLAVGATGRCPSSVLRMGWMVRIFSSAIAGV
jgi:DNA primase